MKTNHQTSVHLFEDTTIRTIQRGDQILFRGKDVCQALQIVNHNDALSSLAEVEREGVAISDPLGGTQEATFVSEPGLYRLIFRSRKESAKKFQDFVYHEVLPSIRRTGSFNPSHQAALLFVDALLERGADIKDAISLTARTTPQATANNIKSLFNQAYQKEEDAANPVDPIATIIIPQLVIGKAYSTSDLLDLLPPKHLLKRGSLTSQRPRLGRLLKRHPGLERILGRTILYTLPKPENKVIPIA